MIHIAGGTYREVCRESGLGAPWDELFGSGLRAAIALRSLGAEVGLATYVGKDSQSAGLALAEAWSISIEHQEIDRTLSFSYAHGLSRPLIDPPLTLLNRPIALVVNGEHVLRFGMLEGDAIVHADRVVYDPQSTFDPRPFQENGSTTKELAIVANRREGRMLTGRTKPSEMGRALIEVHGCKAAVLKLGALGALVATADGEEMVPAFRSPRVFPIGSGDIFSAAFAHGWLVKDQDAVTAAGRASRCVALYCSSPRPPGHNFGSTEATFAPILASGNGSVRRRVYLAGPFFTTAQRWLVSESREALLSHGVEVFSPLHDVGLGPANVVAEKDLAGLKDCDAVFAIVDGFDSGTLFEVGYARCLNVPVIALVQNASEESLKMLRGSGCVVLDDFVTAVYHTVWAALERSR